MSIEGVDVSNHQATFDFRGWQFAIIKASEGNGFRDFRFTQHLNAARAAGCVTAAYHYQRGVSARSQFDLIKSIVSTNIPVIIDVEDGSGPLTITRELIDLLRGAGYSVPLLYLPRWYWRNIGQPSLQGLPPLWGSDYRGGSADWSPYGGLNVALRQYTSTPFDKNIFYGTREEFSALLRGEEVTEEQMNEIVRRVLDTDLDGSGSLSDFVRRNSDLASDKGVWSVDARVLNVALDESGLTLADFARKAKESVDMDRLADKLAERGVKADVDYAKVAQAVVAELKKEGN